jgi:hypothetical protein
MKDFTRVKASRSKGGKLSNGMVSSLALRSLTPQKAAKIALAAYFQRIEP